MRNVMITTVQEDYVTMAHAKGLKDRKVMTGYAARNAILPPLTGFAAFFASAVGGLILVEVVFSYPGVGLTIQQAALGHDYPARPGVAARVRPRPCCSPTSSWTASTSSSIRASGVLMGELSERAPVGLRQASTRRRRGAGRCRSPIRLLLRNRTSAVGVGLLVAIVGVTVLAPWLTSQSPSTASLPAGPAALVDRSARHHRSGLQRVRPGDPRRAHLACRRRVPRR